MVDDQPLHSAQLNKWGHLFSPASGNLFSDLFSGSETIAGLGAGPAPRADRRDAVPQMLRQG